MVTRDTRRFGPGPFVRSMRWKGGPPPGFPGDVPAMARIGTLDLASPITLLAGDNGAGKSTVIEAIAEAMGFARQGGELERSGELPAVPRAVLSESLEPVLSDTKPRAGYFLRAESFFNIAELVDGGGRFAPDISLYGHVPLHEQSHGQSFLALASNRFGADGLYILDEPEAALSVSGALALVAIMARAAREGAQFIVATHSPIVLACPGAALYELGDDGAVAVEYDDIDAVRLTRSFLAAPERFLRAALDDD